MTEEIDNILKKMRMNLAKKHSLKKIPSNIEMLKYLSEKPKNIITKPTRTISGVAPVAVMTKPIKCPHGKCIMCPGGPDSHFGNIPQSYTGKEPATMRGIRNEFDPYLQVFNRLEHYILLNQNPEKVEIIIMGGTFPSFDKRYQGNFVKYVFKALNDFSELFYNKDNFDFVKFRDFFELHKDKNDVERFERVKRKLKKLKGKCELEKEKLRNEKAKIRCVALCIETRPDYCKKEHIKQMLKLGCTRVELGIQSIYDDILKKIKRGHNVDDTVKATRLLKNSFLKVGYHVMVGLPGSDKKRDIEMFKELFSNEDFKPDALKIYPCLVLKGTELYNLYNKKKYKPLDLKKASDIISDIKKYIPEYCRVMRIQRDVPTYATEAGPEKTNLRQYVEELCIEKNIKCKCIRCREPRNKKIDWNNVKLLRKDYDASEGHEVFLSYEDVKNNILIGFLRLRIFDKKVGVRELHVYGKSVEIGKKGDVQHKGLGKKLVLEAEKIAKKKNCDKMYIISGVGVKEYYKKLGYRKDGVYVGKRL